MIHFSTKTLMTKHSPFPRTVTTTRKGLNHSLHDSRQHKLHAISSLPKQPAAALPPAVPAAGRQRAVQSRNSFTFEHTQPFSQ